MPSPQPLLAFLLLLAYFALHSLLAADKFKAWFSQKMGASFRFYRLIYNVLAALLLFFLLRWMYAWPEEFLFHTNIWTKGAALLLLALGGWMVLGALLQYDLREFVGIQQLLDKNTIPEPGGLNTSGFNAIVRHPLYLGLILLLLGTFLFHPKTAALLLLMSVLVYLPFGIYWEEKKLRMQFGQAYLDYEKKVKCLFPL